MKAYLDKNTSFNIELDGSEKGVIESLDKILPFLQSQGKNTHKNRYPDYVYYDEVKETFVKIDVAEAIRKEADAQLK